MSTTVNKPELVAILAGKLDVTKKETTAWVDVIFGEIKELLEQGKDVRISGVFSAKVVEKSVTAEMPTKDKVTARKTIKKVKATFNANV